jgi:acetylornithine/N-succinyldiaminopimelate aminotransferase
MTQGTHGSTFGGNPLAMAVGNAVLDVMLAPGFLENVQRSADRLRGELALLGKRHPSILEEVRGKGLMIGLKLGVPNTEMQGRLRDQGLLTVTAGDNVLRLLPPLIIGDAEIAEGLAILERVFSGWTAAS